jgi:hypothetical protein
MTAESTKRQGPPGKDMNPETLDRPLCACRYAHAVASGNRNER